MTEKDGHPLSIAESMLFDRKKSRRWLSKATYIDSFVYCANHGGAVAADACTLGDSYTINGDIFQVICYDHYGVALDSKGVCLPVLLDVYRLRASKVPSNMPPSTYDYHITSTMSDDESDDEALVDGEDDYCCYVLQSDSKPSRTYVGITNDRFKRWRRHNGEITGGARATRAHRPWRMVAFVDGFGADKNAALRFEWSCHHPRQRRLRRPWHGRSGRLNCIRQLLGNGEWSAWPLRLMVLNEMDFVGNLAYVPARCLDQGRAQSAARAASLFVQCNQVNNDEQ